MSWTGRLFTLALLTAALGACSPDEDDVFDGDGDESGDGGSGGSSSLLSSSESGGPNGPSAGAGMWGGPCDEDVDCPRGHVCNDKVNLCGPLGQDGTPCAFDDDCVTHCNSKLDACLAPGPPGTPCFFDSDCISMVCGEGDTCT
jgi:hypothetical protein